MKKSTTIIITMEGGIIQSVNQDTDEEIDVAIIDYDTEGVEKEEIHQIPQEDGSINETAEATVLFPHVYKLEPSSEILKYIKKI